MALYCCFQVILNKIITSSFPSLYSGDIEVRIGWMGFFHCAIAIPGTFLMGKLLDTYKCYRTQAFIMSLMSCLTLLVFSLILFFINENFVADNHQYICFYVLFELYGMFGLYGMPFLATGLQHAVVLCPSISPGTSGGILIAVGNIYTIIAISGIGYLVNHGYVVLGCLVMTMLYGIASVFAFYTKV